MRALFIPAIALALITAPAWAQNTNGQNTAAKDNKQSATAQAPARDSKTGTPQQEQQAQAPAKDESMADYNVLGSTAQSAFGHDGP